MKMRAVLLLLICCCVFWASVAPAQDDSPQLFHAQLSGLYLDLAQEPSLKGGKLEAAAVWIPSAHRGWTVGPKVDWSILSGSGRVRHDLAVGVVTELWFVNLIAPGLALNWIMGDWESGEPDTGVGVEQVRVQVEPFLAVRFKRVGEDGALALRFGAVYDTVRKWGLELGILIQLSGVR